MSNAIQAAKAWTPAQGEVVLVIKQDIYFSITAPAASEVDFLDEDVVDL